MSTTPSRAAVLRRILVSWYTPVAIGALLVIGLAAWVTPVPIKREILDAATGQSRTVTAWDTSRWQAVSAFWWQALLLVLGIAAVLGLTWGGRGWIVAKASAARFFAISLLCHCLLLLSLGGVPLARAVVEHAEIIRVTQAAQLLETQNPAHPGERPAYEKVADLRAEDAARPPLVRQAAPLQTPEVAEPLVATIPMHAARGLPPQRVLFVPFRQPEVVRQPLEIPRRSAVATLKPVEINLDAPAPPPPEPAPTEKPITDRLIAQARQAPVAPIPGESEPLRLPELKRPPLTDLRPKAVDLPRVREEKQSPNPLAGRRQPGRIALAAPREPNTELKAESPPVDGPPADGRSVVPRLSPPPSGRPPDEPPRPRLPLKQPARADIPSPKPLDAKPTFSPLADRLPRAVARADREARIEDKIAAPPLLILRKKEERQRSVERYGGSKASEAAVERGLDWLAAHQNANGSWSLNHPNCKHPRCPNTGTVHSDPAGTGVALLPFLGAGHTDQSGKHRQTVARALHWLVTQQQPNGTWRAPADARPMYGHALASIAMCEAYGMTQNAKLRGPAQKALDYIVKAQHPATGGWRYKPNEPADTSVVGWQMMALKSGEMAGLPAPPRTFQGIKRWLKSVEGNRPVGGQFGYQSASPTPAMTAQGLLCMQYLGARRDDPRMRAGTDYLLRRLPRAGAETTYYWYHANQVMYHMQGKHWKAWNDKLRDLLTSTQEVRGSASGSWKPVDSRESPGGRLYATALRVLMLEVYYRHLPLYQQLEK